MTAEDLKNLIAAGLVCQHITLEGDGRHWYATIVSPEFEGKRPIQRHQRVYATLGSKMQTDEVHALSMKTFTPAEWAQAQGMGPPRYVQAARSGPDHAPEFEIVVRLDDGREATASGKGTKRSIEQAAAAAMIEQIEGTT